ncbi:MAG: hypothetical protein AAGL96_07565, partial [Pseudomonadota bacterium]
NAANAAATAAAANIAKASLTDDINAAHAATAAVLAAAGTDATYSAIQSADSAANFADDLPAAEAPAFDWVREDLRHFLDDPRGALPPLWDRLYERASIAGAWTQAKSAFEDDPAADWRVFILWYERVRAGRNIQAAALAKILDTLTQEEIEGDPALVLPRFDPLLEIYEREDAAGRADPIELIKAETVLSAALSDFAFDKVLRLMKMVPFASDIAQLEDEETLSRFLDEAEEMRENIERMAEGLRREGTAMQGAGLVGLELESLLEEFSKARQLQSLNVGKIVKFGEFLQEAAQDEATRREFGNLAAKRLDQIVDDLLSLVRCYFGQTLLRFAPLEELELEPETNAWEYLNEVRVVLRDMEAQAHGPELTALAPEDVRVLMSLADEIERSLRQHASASGEARSSFERDMNYRFALLTVSVALYGASARDHAGTLRAVSDRLLKDVKIVKGLWALWQTLKAELF